MATKGGGGRKSKSGKLVVAAIDFGTTFSGYAFSFNHDYETDPTKVSVNTSWVAGTAGLMSLKTPTILLLDNSKKFVAFGYEAEEQYSDIAAEEKHKEYYYFRRFKMLLHKVAVSTSSNRNNSAISVIVRNRYSYNHSINRFSDTVAE